MKKLITPVLSLVILAMATLPVAAQTRSRCRNIDRTRSVYRTDSYRTRRARSYETYQVRNDQYRNDNYRDSDDQWPYEDNRSVWERHRDKITTAAGAGGGAAIGGMLGGKKGAIIGAIAGGAGAAIYTYKIRDKYNRY
ncbi:MAG TPA: hypothetical protein VJU84_16245 [Pyrinomonadaceae bacterium]|nr:hypothetical protein [Pyrinomonadaceae bacterium]